MIKNKIGIIGPYPPPYGGVSIHIQRLLPYLHELNIPYIVYNLGSRRKGYEPSHSNSDILFIKHPVFHILASLLNPKERVLHIHYPDWKIWVLYGLLKYRGVKVIITLHNPRLLDILSNKSSLKYRVIVCILKNLYRVIVVNEYIAEKLTEAGEIRDNVVVIPAFIPPIPCMADNLEIASSTWDFINSHYPIISSNASDLRWYLNCDLYGVDLIVDLCSVLKSFHPNIGVVVFISDVSSNIRYYNYLKDRVCTLGISENICFVIGNKPFYPILRTSSLFIRPTNTDGDAISIREALYFGIPVLASDVVTRPSGCNLFKTRDLKDLVSMSLYLLSQDYSQELSSDLVGENSVGTIISLYQEALMI